jgi:nucleotide-binding universal stress UspA family protein
MYKHILVAIGPRLSEGALTTAIARARDCNARLTALHVVDPSPWWAVLAPDANAALTLAVIDDYARAVTGHAMRMMERAGIDGTTRCAPLPLTGAQAGDVIAQEARTLGADLIVLGGEANGDARHGAMRLRDTVCARTNCDVLIASHAPADHYLGDFVPRLPERIARQSAPRN